jgi:ATP-binding cassette, subfamily B, multidrug efflux pump
MMRLAKYLKPFLPMIVLAIVLLFIQANADLALPDYMSRIVNNGIQQGGVENSAPSAIRQQTMDRLMLFLNPAEQALVQEHYLLIDQNSPDFEQYVIAYPALAGEAVFVLKTEDRAVIQQLNPIMGKALLVVAGLEKFMADPSQAPQFEGEAGFDLSILPPGTDLFALLKNAPAAMREQMSAAVNQQFAVMNDKMIVQAAVGVVKAEYEALGVDTEALQNGYILRTGGIMLLISLLGAACTVAVSYLSAKTASGLARDVRRDVFRKVESFSSTEFDRFSTASLITRSTNDVTQVQMFVIMMIRMVFYAPIMGVGGIIRAMGKDSSMWWLIAVAVVMLISLVVIVFTIAQPKFKIMQSLIDRLNLVMRENLAGMMVIRAFNKQEVEENRFDNANTDLTSTNLFVNRVMVVMFPLMMLIMNVLTIAILWVGAHQVAQARMQVGDMIAFMQYAMQIVFSFLMMSFMFIILPRATVSAGRISDVLEVDPIIRDPQQPLVLNGNVRGLVEFRNVSFRYPHAEEDVLRDISFTAQPGQTTAFIGSTGSGKSTIVNLIPRFYDVTAGAILVDGKDIREVTQHDLREKIGYVPQKSNLFSGTIESNLRYADEHASEDLLIEAVEVAQASEFIASNSEGMAAEIAQGGMNVSGGQKQRLSIARALVKQAPIFIFDDSFSALDFKTDAALRRAMKAKTAESTLLIVTQRVSTIKNADQIIVLDEGKLMGKGTHHELMQTCETYREIALSQLSAEELS